MIFVSHNHKDKVVVEQVAIRLRDIFGEENVFYDSWSMQPGDGIIDKMNEGLKDCELFLFFVSKNSLASNMVKLEWQNALMKATAGHTKIIPVKLDDCLMPPILMQSIYIDLFGQGLENALRQIVDVASGRSTFSPGPQHFSNLRAYVYEESGNVIIECRAEHFMEPKSHFLVLVENAEGELTFKLRGESMVKQGFNKGVRLADGRVTNAQLMAVSGATTPGFPFIIEITPKSGKRVSLIGINHEKSRDNWVPIPFINSRPT